MTLDGKRVFVTHYPVYGRAIACTGDYDVVCCGHDHVASIDSQANIKGGKTWLLNPGTVAGLGAPATWLLADLDTCTFQIRPIVTIIEKGWVRGGGVSQSILIRNYNTFHSQVPCRSSSTRQTSIIRRCELQCVPGVSPQKKKDLTFRLSP